VPKDNQPLVGPRPDHYYLKYVTLGQALHEMKVALILWLYFGLVCGVIGYLVDRVGTAATRGTPLDTVPNTLWAWVAIVVLSWVLRGKSISLPMLTFRKWFVFSVGVGVGVLAGVVLPFWAFWPIWQGLAIIWTQYGALVEIGRSNYAKEVIPEHIVILLAGIPGTGKTTFARHLTRRHRQTAGAAEDQRRKCSQRAARTTASSAVQKTYVCCTGCAENFCLLHSSPRPAMIG
jgi:hypothetical protein